MAMRAEVSIFNALRQTAKALAKCLERHLMFSAKFKLDSLAALGLRLKAVLASINSFLVKLTRARFLGVEWRRRTPALRISILDKLWRMAPGPAATGSVKVGHQAVPLSLGAMAWPIALKL